MKETLERRRARLAAIVRHIPALCDPAASVSSWQQPEAEPGYITATWSAPSETAKQFVADCYEHGWVLAGFDWATWAQTEGARALRDDPTALARAGEHQLAQLLTVAIRQDRFVEGALATAFNSGLVLRILRRAEGLAREARTTAGGQG